MTTVAPDASVQPLLTAHELELLRKALTGFDVDGVAAQLGPRGSAALQHGDLAGATRALRDSTDSRVADLCALFVLGAELDEPRAATALAPLPLDAARAGGLLERSGAAVRAALEIRPYGEAIGADPASEAPWWVVSDLGSDVRPGPLANDHVLGIGSASLTLAQATPRLPAGRALDIGTGCGIQALHLAQHSAAVTATDVSDRALQLAATTAALSVPEMPWDLRRGSLLEPVAGERYDLVVANPPFVVSAGGRGHDYRDSGLAGDAVCESLLRGLPDVLAPGGTAVVLANWVLRGDEVWSERLGSWLEGRGCDAWAWQREVAGPDEYVSLWLRDAGYFPGHREWTQRYDAWCSWFERAGVAGVGMGMITLWQTDAEPVLVFDDVRQPVQTPVAPAITAWHERARWLQRTSDAGGLAARLRPAPDLVLARGEQLGTDGWRTEVMRLRQSDGLRWEVEIDEPMAAVLAGCAAGAPLRTCLELLSAVLDDDGTSPARGPKPEGIVARALPVIRDLISRGFVVPDELLGAHRADGTA